MIELRFRAWDSEDKKMYDVEELTFLNIKNLPSTMKAKLWNGEDFIERFTNRITVMQYLGDNDLFGTSICVGDILKNGRSIIYVESVDRFFWMKYDDQMRIDFLQYEIIGNIYENPDMVVI